MGIESESHKPDDLCVEVHVDGRKVAPLSYWSAPPKERPRANKVAAMPRRDTALSAAFLIAAVLVCINQAIGIVKHFTPP